MMVRWYVKPIGLSEMYRLFHLSFRSSCKKNYFHAKVTKCCVVGFLTVFEGYSLKKDAAERGLVSENTHCQ